MKTAYVLFFFLAFFFLAPQIFATSNVAEAAQEMSPTPTPQVNYELPYPGLLPNNPLYFLKVIRDQIVGFLISDPLKKGEFDLLQADKRVNGALYLFNKYPKKSAKISQLVDSTVSKAENYLGLAIEMVSVAKKQGRDTADLLRRLKESVKKHQEVLQKLHLSFEAQRAKSFEKEVELLNHQN